MEVYVEKSSSERAMRKVVLDVAGILQFTSADVDDAPIVNGDEWISKYFAWRDEKLRCDSLHGCDPV